jgi:HEAT repeat protein
LSREGRIPALAGAFLLLATVVVFCRAGEPRPEAEAAVTDPALSSDTLATALLAMVRGADPVVCELAVRAVDGRHGWSSTVDELAGVGATLTPLQRATVHWAVGDGKRMDRDAASIEPLAAGLRDVDPCVRRMAALKLGRTRAPRAIAELRAALTAPDPGLRAAGALGLGYAEEPGTLGDLADALGDDSAAVRATAAWALGSIEDERAIPRLLPVLSDDADPNVRKAAAWALGEIE